MRTNDTSSSTPVSPSLEPIEYDFAVGDRVRFMCHGKYHHEAGIIMEIEGTPKMRVYFVRMDSPKLNLPQSGRVPTTGEALQRMEPVEGAGA